MEYKASVTKLSLFLADLSEGNKTLKEENKKFKKKTQSRIKRSKLIMLMAIKLLKVIIIIIWTSTFYYA